MNRITSTHSVVFVDLQKGKRETINRIPDSLISNHLITSHPDVAGTRSEGEQKRELVAVPKGVKGS